MPGGFLQLTTYQIDGGDFTNYKPEITFFKSVFKRYTNFSIENIAVEFNNYSEPDWEKPMEYISRLDNIGHVLNNMYLTVSIPQFQQDTSLDLKWINNLGLHIIESVQFSIGGEIIQEFSSDWINIYYKRYLRYEQYLQQLSLINVNNNSPDRKNILNVATDLHIFLPFYFSKDYSLSLPFLNVEYQSIYVKIIIKPIKHWITLIETKTESPYFGKRISPYSKNYINIIKSKSTGKFIFSLNAHCGFLETDEFNKLRNSTLNYLIDQNTEIIQNGVVDKKISITINQRLPIKELWILPSRDDIPSRNTYGQYSHLENFEELDADLLKPLSFLTSAYTPTSFLRQYWLFYTGNEQLHTHNIIEDVSLILDEQYRFKTLESPYLALIQPFIHKYHFNTLDYIYNYSFALDPLQYQPSGFLNMDRIHKAHLIITMASLPPPKPVYMTRNKTIDGCGRKKGFQEPNNTQPRPVIYQPESEEFQPYNNEKYAYKFNIKIIMVNFNILRIKGGMADILIRK
jgi:hypothetical protein